MDMRIIPSPLCGKVQAIGSKSDVHRIFICAALADKPTVITGISPSEDISATAACIEALGAKAEFSGKSCKVTPIASSCGKPMLDCGESGSTLRFMLPVASAVCDNAAFTGRGRLPQRPIGELMDAMRTGGVSFTADKLPLETVGRLRAGEYSIAGNVSSQYITGLLLALSVVPGESILRLTTPLESAPYVDMTLSALNAFGAHVEVMDMAYKIIGRERLVSPGALVADGDWSNAAFFLVSAAVCGDVEMSGLDLNSRQGDKSIVDILEKFGARVDRSDDVIRVRSGVLRACEVDISDTPDMLPALSVLAAFSKGRSRFTGAARLRLKESDRLVTTAAMINALGGAAEVFDDGIAVNGTGLVGGTVDGAGDHRIVMAAAAAAANCTRTVDIIGAQASHKSYPAFFEDYNMLGGMANVI